MSIAASISSLCGLGETCERPSNDGHRRCYDDCGRIQDQKRIGGGGGYYYVPDPANGFAEPDFNRPCGNRPPSEFPLPGPVKPPPTPPAFFDFGNPGTNITDIHGGTVERHTEMMPPPPAGYNNCTLFSYRKGKAIYQCDDPKRPGKRVKKTSHLSGLGAADTDISRPLAWLVGTGVLLWALSRKDGQREY